MSFKDSVEESVSWARQRLGKIRLSYLDAIHEAERQGGSRLDEMKRQVEQLGPGLRHLVDERVEALQHKLDEINRRLAEEAVPDERKSRVGRLALERKAASAARKASSVVRSRTRGKAPSSSAPAKAPKTSKAKGDKRNDAAQKGNTASKPKRQSTSGKSTASKSRSSSGKSRKSSGKISRP